MYPEVNWIGELDEWGWEILGVEYRGKYTSLTIIHEKERCMGQKKSNRSNIGVIKISKGHSSWEIVTIKE